MGASVGPCPVLQDIHLPVLAGCWTSIVGPNGAGKSTLLRALAGLMPHTGTVHLLGRELADWPRRDKARALSWLGQNEAAADDLTVYDVAMLGRLPHQPWLAPPSAADHAAVEQALRATHAWDWRQRTLGGLSGGERQRVLLARALATEARLHLWDEPLAPLDPRHVLEVLQLSRELTRAGAAMLISLHDLRVAHCLDMVVVLQDGRLRAAGKPADVLTPALLADVFGVRARTAPSLILELP